MKVAEPHVNRRCSIGPAFNSVEINLIAVGKTKTENQTNKRKKVGRAASKSARAFCHGKSSDGFRALVEVAEPDPATRATFLGGSGR